MGKQIIQRGNSRKWGAFPKFLLSVTAGSSTCLAPRTGFVEDNFSTGWGWGRGRGDGFGMIQVHYTYCVLYFYYYYIVTYNEIYNSP